MSFALFAMLTGCAPQDAEVTAHWYTWLAANSSPTIAEGDLDETLAQQALAIECSGRGWDANTETFDLGYIGPDNIYRDAAGYLGGDCDPDDGGCDADALAEECAEIDALFYHTFLQDDGFYFMEAPVEPYRTEAYLNGEGDFQLTVHHRLDNREDFRFHFTIAPDFAPVDCVTGSDGEPEQVYVDGARWLEEWSADEDGYTIYYLNAGAFQRNPADTDDYWYLTTDWLAGFGEAKFAAEQFATIPAAYGDYDHLDDYELSAGSPDYRAELFTNSGHFIGVTNREDPDMSEYEANVQLLEEYAGTWAEEMRDVAGASVEDYEFTHEVEGNLWREVDTQVSGLDGWMELHSSWVRIKSGATFEKGTAVEGDYQLFYQGLESASRLLVKGTFRVESLREDPWAYPFLEDVKRDEYGNPYCGGAPAPSR